MSKQVGSVSRPPGRGARTACERPSGGSGTRALELVATRGADVLGVRHVLEGGQCWVGPAQSSIAHISMSNYGGAALVVADVIEGRCTLHVPPRARGRMHGSDGIGRLLMGPVDVEVCDGDRLVLVIGSVQIRARIMHIETVGNPALQKRRDAVRWLVAMGGLYIAALAICAAVAPEKPRLLERGAMQRAVAATLARAAEKTRHQDATARSNSETN